MGLLVNGLWKDIDYQTEKNDGHFIRDNSNYRNSIDSSTSYIPESNRYHLYVSYACPWAHRTLIMRELKSLNEVISVDAVHPYMLKEGWMFKGDSKDSINNKNYLHEIYTLDNPNYSGRVTVPILWDKKNSKIVNNESADIIRIFNSAFDPITKNKEDFYPQPLRDKIDEINDLIYNKINNGVYKVGFATTQNAYSKAFDELFETLEKLDSDLANKSFLVGDTLTEADIRFFTTLIRFDLVYYSHFKCNYKRMSDFRNLNLYLKRLYAINAFKKTTLPDHIKGHYYYSHTKINPNQIIPNGPYIEWL